MGIRTIIVMGQAGIPLFSGNYICPMGRNCDILSKDDLSKTDPSLISGFFSALMKMATVSGGELQHISFENFQYLAKSSNQLIVIMAIGHDDKLEDYQHRIQVILEKFLEHFGDKIEEWTGNLAIFDAFQTVLDESEMFDHKPKFKKNCIECEVNHDCTFRMVTTSNQQLNFQERLALFPKMNIFAKIKAWMKEYFKYLKQYKRYQDYRKQYKEEKQSNPKLTLVDFINTPFSSK